MKKYTNLFKQFEKLDFTTKMINYNIESIDSGLRSGYSVQSSLVINPIEKFGSQDLKNKYLDKLYSGEYIGCFGLT